MPASAREASASRTGPAARRLCIVMIRPPADPHIRKISSNTWRCVSQVAFSSGPPSKPISPTYLDCGSRPSNSESSLRGDLETARRA
jgi:hypothetical protein